MDDSIGIDGRDRIIETRLWIEEHEWLYALLLSEDNVCPTFRFPDLIGACVSLALSGSGGPERIFKYLGTQLVLRDPRTPRRRASLWAAEYKLLLALQQSPANRHPHPRFQLDQFTTACVALVRAADDAAAAVLRQARANVAARSTRLGDRQSG